MTPRKLPSLSMLHEMFRYDEATGKLFWRIGRRTGMEAGHANKLGYRNILYQGRMMLAHRIIWKMHYEREPQEAIDHIDGNPRNNLTSNLREGTKAKNCQNRAKQRKRTSKYFGVSKFGAKWRAVYILNGKQVYLGCFETEKEAAHVYDSAIKAAGTWHRLNFAS